MEKNIIYGNPAKNSYGTFQCFCSPIAFQRCLFFLSIFFLMISHFCFPISSLPPSLPPSILFDLHLSLSLPPLTLKTSFFSSFLSCLFCSFFPYFFLFHLFISFFLPYSSSLLAPLFPYPLFSSLVVLKINIGLGQIEETIDYLKKHDHFKKYRKFIYAYRISQACPFVTENENNELSLSSPTSSFLSLSNLISLSKVFMKTRLLKDQEKNYCIFSRNLVLLIFFHLMFNDFLDIENVLLIIGVDQNDPLALFSTYYFKIMIQKSKDLLNNLYSKASLGELNGLRRAEEEGSMEEGVRREGEKEKKGRSEEEGREEWRGGRQEAGTRKTQIINLGEGGRKEERGRKKEEGSRRVNYFGEEGLLAPVKKVIVSPRVKKKRELERKIQKYSYEIERIVSELEEPDFIQLKFMAQYDNDPLISKVFRFLTILEDYPSLSALAMEYDFESRLPKLSSALLSFSKLKYLKDVIRQEKKLNFDSLMLLNPTIAYLYQIIMLIIKLFEAETSLRKEELGENDEGRKGEDEEKRKKDEGGKKEEERREEREKVLLDLNMKERERMHDRGGKERKFGHMILALRKGRKN